MSAGSWLGPAVGPVVILTGVLAPSSPLEAEGDSRGVAACVEGLHSDPRGLTPERHPGPRPHRARPSPWRMSGGAAGTAAAGREGNASQHARWESGAQAGRGRKLASWVPDVASLGLRFLVYQMGIVMVTPRRAALRMK